MRALGAELDVIPSVEGRPNVTAQDIKNMVARAAELAARPGHYATDQFNNPYIIPDHRDAARARDLGADRGTGHGVLPGHGTASSLMGVSDALRPHGVFIQAHEPACSAAIGGGEPGPFADPGLDRAGHAALGRRAVDHLEPIGDDEAVEMTRGWRARRASSPASRPGANVVGAHRLAERLGPDAVIVTLAVDTGFKYLSVKPFASLQ